MACDIEGLVHNELCFTGHLKSKGPYHLTDLPSADNNSLFQYFKHVCNGLSADHREIGARID